MSKSTHIAGRARALRGAVARSAAMVAFGLALSLAAPEAGHAQALDQLQVDGSGQDAILRIHFNVHVQYVRHTPPEASDLIEIYFRLLGNDDSFTLPVEESLTLLPPEPAPGATVVYPAQAGLPVKKVLVRLSRKADFRVREGRGNQVIEIVLPGLAPRMGQPPAPVPEPPSAAAPETERGRFAISLQSLPVSEAANIRAIPPRLQGHAVFGSEVLHGGTRHYDLVVGYFDTEAEAQKVLADVLEEFPGAQVFEIAPRRQEVLEAAAAIGPGPEATPQMRLDAQADGLMARARAALAAGRYEAAIQALNQLLLLPPNRFSQDAQELLGLARERTGDLLQARKEYGLYLRLFPEGDGATRVRQRLVALPPP